MEIPVIDLEGLSDNLKSETMELLHQACENWGFFQVTNHGINVELMDKVKKLVNLHYEECMKRSRDAPAVDSDWESSYFIWHRPKAMFDESINLSDELSEKLSELICENLSLEKDYMKKAFSATAGPSVGTKVAKYPQCDRPELVTGLRAHTDAVPGLEFLKDGKWVEIPPSKNNTIFVNTGDQIEVLSNGKYKSTLHRVLADKNGSRLSIATFYNPAPDALISPASELLYPNQFRFQDYLTVYSTTKFSEKGPRFETMKKMTSGQCSLPA
ncbi:hypothetical protein MKW92_048329 [Papaver armeniacum]|nr:hypothetical protein MKW92_048329 [Papaver armeniacum]